MSVARSCAVASAAALFVVACGNAPPVSDQPRDDVEAAIAALPDASVASQLTELRTLTSPYSDLQAAQAAGWSMQVPRCRDNQPEGAMGWHYANPNYIDAGVDVMKPEVLIYEPQADGTQALVGVEYIIPYTELSRDAEPPTLFGERFLHNDNDELWMMHVWLWRNNPQGLFATWNPSISCAHAHG